MTFIRCIWHLLWHESDPLNVCWEILIQSAQSRPEVDRK